MEKRCSEKKGHPLIRVNVSDRLQLFRERLSEKAPVTIPKGNCGWFYVHGSSKKLQERHERPWTYVRVC